MKMYTGNKLCGGCGRPGSERSRFSADDICHDCKDFISLGKKTDLQNKTQSEYYYVHIYPFYVSDTNQSSLFFNKFKVLAKSISDDTKETTSTLAIGNHSSSYGISVKITPTQYEALKELYKTVQDNFRAIEHKGKIEGSSLLIQLNSGAITLDKFDENLKSKL